MSADPDDDFIAVFAKKKPGQTTVRGAVKSTQDAPEATVQTGLRPPERRIAAAQRSHQRAVNTVVRAANVNRSLALSGIEAAEDADRYANTRSSGTPSTQHVTTPKPSGVSADALLKAALNESMKADADDTRVIQLWNWAASAAKTELEDVSAPGAPEADIEVAAVRFMQCMSNLSAVFQDQEQTRNAINALESSVTVVSGLNLSVPEVSKALLAAYQTLMQLHKGIGSIDAVRNCAVKIMRLKEALGIAPSEAGASAPSASGQPKAHVQAAAQAPAASAAVAEQKQQDKQKKGKGKGKTTAEAASSEAPAAAAAPVPAPAPVAAPTAASAPAPAAAVPAATTEGTSTSATIAAPAPAAPAAPEEVVLAPIPVIPEDDGTAGNLFKRAVYHGMFNNSFEDITTLLNNGGLFGDEASLEALGMDLDGITLVMVCAGGDRPDLVKRLLVRLPPKDAAHAIVHARDKTGNNAIMHACGMGRQRALDELLRQLHATRPVYVPFSGDKASLDDVGVTLEAARKFSPPVQAQLRSFLQDPERYVKANTAYGLGTGAAGPSGPAASGPAMYGMPLGGPGPMRGGPVGGHAGYPMGTMPMPMGPMPGMPMPPPAVIAAQMAQMQSMFAMFNMVAASFGARQGLPGQGRPQGMPQGQAAPAAQASRTGQNSRRQGGVAAARKEAKARMASGEVADASTVPAGAGAAGADEAVPEDVAASSTVAAIGGRGKAHGKGRGQQAGPSGSAAGAAAGGAPPTTGATAAVDVITDGDIQKKVAAKKGGWAAVAAGGAAGAPASAGAAAGGNASGASGASGSKGDVFAAPAAKGKAGPTTAAGRLAAGGPSDFGSSHFAGMSLDDDAAALCAGPHGKRGGRGKGGRKHLFDQFKANEELFGIKATFRAEDYTSTIDESMLTSEQIAAATALAREVEGAEAERSRLRKAQARAAAGKPAAKDEDEEEVDDEEAEYSAVVR